MPLIPWRDIWPEVRDVLVHAQRGATVAELLPELQRRTGFPITARKLSDACQATEGCGPRSLIGSECSSQRYAVPPPPPSTDPAPPPSPATSAVSTPHVAGFDSASFPGKGGQKLGGEPELATFAELMRLCKRGIPFGDLCDQLDMAPSRVRRLIDDARAVGYRVDIAGDVVAQREPEPSEVAQDVGVAPVVGDRFQIAVISDTHFGSKYCLRKQLKEFVRHAYDRGCRHVLHAGDMLDGCYRHGQWELTHHGVDDQIQDALDTLPRIDGLNYHYIAGNHDETFTAATGLDTGRLIQDRARASGRADLHYHGCRDALLKLGTVKIELWHPRSGKAYSLSYHLQNYIRDMPAASGRKPDLIFAGHWHTAVYFEQRGIHACGCPTFQGGGSAFGKSLSGAPSIGGLIVSWELTQHGTLRRVAVERSSYYDVEHYREVA